MTTTEQDRDVGHFDRWSSSYEASWMQRVFFDPAHRAALMMAGSVIQHTATVLDVGCGTGRLLRDVASWWPEAQLIGVDPAEGMIEEARRLTPAATFYLGSGESLPLPDASVDLALSTISFHHWADQAAGVREIARVLRPGGYFVLVDFSVPGWLRPVLRMERIHTRAEIQALFAQAGLRVERQQQAGWRRWLATAGRK